jgi:hypothetical protein
MKSKILFLGLLLAMGLWAAAAPVSASPEVKYIDAPTVKSMLGSPDVVVIDTSTGWWTYDQKIVGSIIHPEPAREWAAQFPKDKKIILYCG